MATKLTPKKLLQVIRRRPGHLTACSLVLGLFSYTYIKGPEVQSQSMRYVLAGTTAIVGVELGSHFIDTINMKSKIITPQESFFTKQQVRRETIFRKMLKAENWRGYQQVITGYMVSSLFFFSVQYYSKVFSKGVVADKSDSQQEDSRLAMKAFIISLIGTALAEIAALPFYYPYDLVKVRMQTMQEKYGYRNFVDGAIKIWKEKVIEQKVKAKPSNPLKKNVGANVKKIGHTTAKLGQRHFPTGQMALEKEITFLRRVANMLKGARRLRNYYSGAFYYGLAYTAFISLEFAIHDALIEYLGDIKDQSLFYYLMAFGSSSSEEKEQSEKQHTHWHNELMVSFTAGYAAAFLTNGIETVAVNKQTNPGLGVKDILFHNTANSKKKQEKKEQKKAGAPSKPKLNEKLTKLKQKKPTSKDQMKKFISVVFQGWQARTMYYGIQACCFFLYLNHLSAHLDIDPQEYE